MRLCIWTLKLYPHRRVPIIPQAATQSESFRWKHPFSLRAVLGTQVNSKFYNASFALKKKKKKTSLNINPQISNLCLNKVPICSPTKILGEVLSPHSVTLGQQCRKKNLHLDSASFRHSLLLLICFLLSLFSFFCFLIIASGYYVQSIDGNGWFWSMES